MLNNNQKSNSIENNEKIISLYKIIFSILLFSLIGVSLTIWYEYYNNDLTILLSIQQNSIDPLINTIWQIQTGITTLTIALLSLLIGLNTEKRYGIKVLRFMIVKNKNILSFYDKILISLFLLFVQYAFVAYNALAGAVFLLFVSILLISFMIYISIKTVMFESEVRKEMKSYILNNFKIENKSKSNLNRAEEILENLYEHTLESIRTSKLKFIEENLALFKEIYSKILSTQNYESPILKSCSKYINDLGKRLLKNEFYEQTKNMMNQNYELAQKNKISYLSFKNIFIEFNRIIKEEESCKIIEDLSIMDLFRNALKSINDPKKYINIYLLANNYYTSIYRNKKLNEEEKERLINDIFINLSWFHYIDSEISFKMAVYVLKGVIDYKDKRLIKLLKFLDSEKYSLDKEVFNKILIITSIYLYYLSYNKKNFQKDKIKYLNLINDLNKKFKYKFENISCNFWSYYEEIQDELKSWILESSKIFQMSSVVREFYIFLSIATKKENLDLNEEDVYSFVDDNFNTDGDNFTEDLKGKYRFFIEIFKFNNDLEDDLNLLKKKLKDKYKDIILNRLIDFSKKKEVIDSNKSIIEEEIRKTIEIHPFIDSFEDVEGEQFEVDNIIFPVTKIPLSYIAKESRNKEEYNFLTANVNRMIESRAKQKLIEKGFIHRIVNQSDFNKIDKLFQTINFVQEKFGTQINTLISGISKNSFILFKESEESKDKLSALENKLNTIKGQNTNSWIGFNKEFVKVIIGEPKIEISSLSNEEIENRLGEKDENGMYNLSVMNNINCLFTKEEAKKYLELKETKINVEMKLEYIIQENKVGFILDVLRS